VPTNYCMSKSLFLFFTVSLISLSEMLAQDFWTSRAIEEERWFYNTESGSFQPSFEVTDPDPSLIGFYVELSSDYLHFLRMCAPTGTAIWVDTQLMVGSTEDNCVEFDLLEWRSRFASDSVFVLLHKQGDLISTTSLSTVAYVEESGTASQTILPLKRSIDKKDHFVLLFAMLFFIGAGFFRLQFPRIFRSFVDLNRVLSFRVRDEMVSGFRLLSTPSVTIHLLVSMLAGFFLCVGKLYLEKDQAGGLTLGHYILEWADFSVLILAFLLVKRLLIQIFGAIFQMRGAIYLQVFEYLRSVFILLGVALFVYITFFYLFGGASQWLINNMAFFAFSFLLLAILLMFYKLAFETRYQKLHLFSYLCATEILPAILLLKLMFFK